MRTCAPGSPRPPRWARTGPGRGRPVDCDLARQLLAFARPGAAELDAADAAALERHLADCPACGPAARGEHAFDASLAAAMRAVPLPAGGRGRLLTGLLAARAAWWRRFWLRSGFVVVLLFAACL